LQTTHRGHEFDRLALVYARHRAALEGDVDALRQR
jgi:hypothetical protein